MSPSGRGAYTRCAKGQEAKHVQAKLQPELDTFATSYVGENTPVVKMSTDFSQLLRANFKEFQHSCRYYNGHGVLTACGCETTTLQAFASTLNGPTVGDKPAHATPFRPRCLPPPRRCQDRSPRAWPTARLHSWIQHMLERRTSQSPSW